MEARCPRPATKRGRCDECRRAKERDRSRARRADARERNRFYARRRWQITRRRKLSVDPLCELGYAGCLKIASEVHHRTAMQDGGAEYAMDNLISACKPCHSAETRREQHDRGRVSSEVEDGP